MLPCWRQIAHHWMFPIQEAIVIALSFSLVLQVKITFVACVCCFCLGLPCASYSGQYVLDLMDTYGAGFAVTFVGIWELVSLMWIYGVKNVCKDIKLMLGSEPGWFWKVITRFYLFIFHFLQLFSHWWCIVGEF